MGILERMENNRETTGWGAVGVILALISSPDLFIQALVVILFPVIGWTILYFIQREIKYRFPPKEKDKLLKE